MNKYSRDYSQGHVMSDSFDHEGMVDSFDKDGLAIYLHATTGTALTHKALHDMTQAEFFDWIDSLTVEEATPVTSTRVLLHLASVARAVQARA